MRFALTLVALSVVASPVLAQEGMLFVDQVGSKVYVQSGRIRATDGEGSFIIDTVRGQVTIVDDYRRRYATGSVREICRAVDDWKLATEFAQSQNYLEYERPSYVASNVYETILLAGESLPLDARDVGVAVQKKGKGFEIAGYPTERYLVSFEGIPQVELWLSPHEDFKRLLNKINVSVIQKLESCGIGPTAIDLEWVGYDGRVEASNPYNALLEKGWILRRTERGGEEAGENMLYTQSVRRVEVPASDFKPPRGVYQKVSFVELITDIVADIEGSKKADEEDEEDS